MVTKESLDQELARVNAIDEKTVITPDYPLVDFMQEAADLITTVEQDRGKLEAINFDFSKYDSLEPAIEVLRDCQTQWTETMDDADEARKEWRVKYPEAEELKQELLQTMRFVYDGDKDSLDRVAQITAGAGYRDTIQDLHDIAHKAKKDQDRFVTINYDISLFDKADEMSNSMMMLLSRMNGENSSDDMVKLLRDKAYTHLKGIVDYIRKNGKYIHRNDPDRAALYAIAYKR